jgi:L-ribulose-5-phosphate 3-epimerase
VYSVCADYFMDRPLVRASDVELDELSGKLAWLLGLCRAAGIERMVLPFVDQSKMENGDDANRVVEVLSAALPKAEANSVELHLETSLAPAAFAALLDRLPHRWLKANYDSGNSSSLGYIPREEFAAYGSRIGSVHIKDRNRGGGTVPLGMGDADLEAVFEELSKVGYCGDFVLQVARSEAHREVEWARENRTFVSQWLGRLAGSRA